MWKSRGITKWSRRSLFGKEYDKWCFRGWGTSARTRRTRDKKYKGCLRRNWAPQRSYPILLLYLTPKTTWSVAANTVSTLIRMHSWRPSSHSIETTVTLRPWGPQPNPEKWKWQGTPKKLPGEAFWWTKTLSKIGWSDVIRDCSRIIILLHRITLEIVPQPRAISI